MLRSLLLCLSIFLSGLCFNLDVDHPIIIENPDVSQNESYFGYSGVLYSEGKNGEKWLKIGAPRATHNQGRNEVKRSGIVYHCPYMKKCEVQNNLDATIYNFEDNTNMTYAWTGGCLDISYKYKTIAISAPNWHYTVRISNNDWSSRVRGGIILQNFQRNTLQHEAPLKEPVAKDKLPYYGRAQTGFSLHFLPDSNQLLIGAPGVLNYLGTVMKVSNIEKMKTEWRYIIKDLRGAYNEYLGYAVTSGRFFDKNQVCFVTGIPRASKDIKSNILSGSVLVFQFSTNRPNKYNQHSIIAKAQLFGSHFGEYFGAAVAAGDLNGDHLDDLIVGAPYSRGSDENAYNHGRVYVIYGREQKNKIKFETKRENTIDGTEANGLFGLAVMFLGDLDNDGCAEFAVSAPQDEGSGVVYIYTYSKPTKKLLIQQQILGKEIYKNLKGFGMSFSRPHDIDDNNFSDILVGSPISGHAVLLRSKPTVHVNKFIKASSTISTSNNTLFFQCCYSYEDCAQETLSIVRTLTVDDDYRRFLFENSENSEEKEIIMHKKKEFCELINVTKVVKNYENAISITLTIKIPQNETANKKNEIFISSTQSMKNDTFCKTCPLLSQKALKSETELIMWDVLCGGKICESELIVNANFLNLSKENTIVLGEDNHVSLEVTVLNNRDPAFVPSLEVVLPNGLSLRNGLVNCDTSDGKIMCTLGEQLTTKVTQTFDLTVDVGTTEKELTILFNTSTTTLNTGSQSKTNITLQFERKADFEITGVVSKDIYSKESTSFQNIFKIEKFGPSPMPEIQVDILVPYKIMDSKRNFRKFAEVQEYQGKNDGDQLPKCSITEFERKDNKPGDLINSYDVDINCTSNNVMCLHIKCLVGPFDSVQNYVEIAIDTKLNSESLKDMLLREPIFFTSNATIVLENFTRTGNRSHSTTVSNLLIIQKEFKVPLWILIGSATAGFLILLCLAAGLAQAGFFERRQQAKLRQLKEEALEEEKILEELIRQEFAREKFNLDDEMHEFIRKRDPIKEIEEENGLYGALLQ